MSEAPQPGHDSLPLALERAIDQIADRFDADWRAGRPSRLEDALAAVPTPAQAALLRELLRVEVEYRRQRGETLIPQEYLTRFPEQAAVVRDVLHDPRFLDPLTLSSARHASAPQVPADRAGAAPAVPGYEILGVLGEGGMGVVYKARQVTLNRLVALKMIRAERLPDLASRARFRAEARVVAQFDHPNIVRVHDSGEHAGRPYYALEYVPGGTLLETRAGQPWSAEAAAALLAQLADAVEYAHSQGIVHRDLKPANILLTAQGLPKITDFGLSKQLQADPGGHTMPGQPIGTPSYMAPEQADGRLDDIGPSTDIFGLGSILYYLLTGQPPFQGDRLVAILDQARQGLVPSPRQANPRVPAALERICLRALAAVPQQRYPSAAAFGADLRRFLRRRRRLVLATVAATLLFLLGAGTALLLGKLNTPRDSTAGANASGPTPEALAKRAHEVFTAYCYRCHGQDGQVEGGFNFVLDLSQLVARKKVVPDHPEKSRLFKRLTDPDDPMPPKDEAPRPSEADIKDVEAWIAAGAPDVGPSAPVRAFVTPEQVLQRIRADLEQANPGDRIFRRYFTLTHLHNAGLSLDGLKTYRHGLSKLLNSLSLGSEVIPPQPIDPTETVFRIDLRHYRWDEGGTWDVILQAYPYGVISDPETAAYFTGVTGCPLPSVRADWFVFAASRPPLYHDILKLPPTAAALEEFLGVKPDEDIRNRRVARAGFITSGVSQNNRLIERHLSIHGAYYWRSYDFAGSVGRKNLFEHPLGPGGAGGFQHDGGEIIFKLPNGLQAFLLVDAAGKRLDQGPIAIVSDPKQADRAVVNGISCMSCHTAGIILKDDEVRAAVETNLAFPKADVQLIQDLYPVHDRFKQRVEKDNETFRRAIQQTGAQVGRTDPVGALAQRYEWEVDVKLAAAEVGLKPDAFTKAIARSRLSLTFGPLAARGGTIKRSVLAESFAELIRELQLGEMFPRSVAAAPPPKPVVETPRPAVVADEMENSIGMRLRRLPPGKFSMGSPLTEQDRAADEKQRLVVIARPFAIGVFEVTQGEYETVMKKNPSFHQGLATPDGKGLDTRRFPVEQVSWEDAVAFCKQLSALPAERAKGRAYRLPTEEEWEYACRGGAEQHRTFHVGASLSSAQANFDGRKPYGAAPPGDALGRPRSVGFYQANGFGLYDMHGNVAEWVAEPVKPQIQQVHRGGSWQDNAARCRTASRHHTLADLKSKAWGFRIVLELEPKP